MEPVLTDKRIWLKTKNLHINRGIQGQDKIILLIMWLMSFQLDLIAIIGFLAHDDVFRLLAIVVKALAVEMNKVTSFGQYSLTR